MSESFYKSLIIGVSIVIPVVVVILFYISVPVKNLAIDVTFFPKFHASINSLTFLLLLSGLYFIKQKQVKAHKTCMIMAISLSAIFLVSYVFYHSISEPTSYGGEGIFKYVYYFILITHIFLAAAIVPFILFTFFRALNRQFEKHKKIARWTLPLWLYVAITGVLVYLFMAPYY